MQRAKQAWSAGEKKRIQEAVDAKAKEVREKTMTNMEPGEYVCYVTVTTLIYFLVSCRYTKVDR